MKRVEVIKDEWYPCFSIVDHPGWTGDRIIELTEEEMQQYEHVLKAFRELQSMLEEKYEASTDIRLDRWTKK